jgi:hypothetical protein
MPSLRIVNTHLQLLWLEASDDIYTQCNIETELSNLVPQFRYHFESVILRLLNNTPSSSFSKFNTRHHRAHTEITPDNLMRNSHYHRETRMVSSDEPHP